MFTLINIIGVGYGSGWVRNFFLDLEPLKVVAGSGMISDPEKIIPYPQHWYIIRPHLEELPLPDGGEGVEGHVAHHNEDAAEGGGHRATRVPAVVLAEEEADHADRDEEGHRVLVELVLLLRDQAAHQHYGDHLARLIASTFRDLC